MPTDNEQPLRSLTDAIDNSTPLPADDARTLLGRYPFLAAAAAQALADGTLSDADRRQFMARIALTAAPGSAIRTAVTAGRADAALLADFYPGAEEPETPSTEAAIDTFLDTYGSIDPREQALLERLIFNPVADYSQILAKESADSADSEATAPAAGSQDAMLDAFLNSQAQAAGHTQQQPQPAAAPAMPALKPDASSPLSESLALIYIKKKRYSKAYEIIHHLSLNFPEKSVYFADQLRFLRKLMLLQQLSGKNENES